MRHGNIFFIGIPGLILICLPLQLPAQQTAPNPTPSSGWTAPTSPPASTTSASIWTAPSSPPPGAQTAPPLSSPPPLIAQCTSSASGKLTFELLANFGGVTDTTYYPPWRPSKDDLYPPRLKKPNLTMEFLGYTHVKPVKRQWEALVGSAGSVPLQHSVRHLQQHGGPRLLSPLSARAPHPASHPRQPDRRVQDHASPRPDTQRASLRRLSSRTHPSVASISLTLRLQLQYPLASTPLPATISYLEVRTGPRTRSNSQPRT